jgi:hypothetical protein
MFEPEMFRLLKMSSGISGFEIFDSRSRNATRSAVETPASARVCGSVQPSSAAG